MRRHARAGLVVLALLLVGGLTTAGSALAVTAPDANAETGFDEHIAGERSSRGLGALAHAGDLQEVARRHAERMAERGEPYHNPNLGSEVHGWDVVSENVGVGGSVEQIHDAFMASRTHRNVILSNEHTQVGVGVVRSDDGQLWVVEVFRLPARTVPASASPPAPVATHSPSFASAPLPSTPAAVAPAASMAAPVAAASVAAPTTVSALTMRQAGPAAAMARLDVLRVPVPEEDEGVPGAAWVAALLLAGVVALQANVLRRLGLVA